MMNDLFEMIKDYILKNQCLSERINSFHLLGLSNDLSYPAILIRNKMQNYNLNVYEDLSNIELSVDLILLDDSYDEPMFLNLKDNLINLLKGFVIENEKFQIIGSSSVVALTKRDGVFQADFEIKIRIFFKDTLSQLEYCLVGI